MAGIKIRGLRNGPEGRRASRKQDPKHQPNPAEAREKKAKRNADAYTAFVTLSALSTGLFLAGTGLSVVYGLKLGKAEGTYQLLGHASDKSDQLFTESGKLSRDAQEQVQQIPGLFRMLKNIEEKSAQKNQSVQKTLEETRDEAQVDRKEQKKKVVATGIAAGVGLVGMIVFISAAKITRHRGLMLYGPNRKQRAQIEFTPQLSPRYNGFGVKLHF